MDTEVLVSRSTKGQYGRLVKTCPQISEASPLKLLLFILLSLPNATSLEWLEPHIYAREYSSTEFFHPDSKDLTRS